jgi:hypothetical protein
MTWTLLHQRMAFMADLIEVADSDPEAALAQRCGPDNSFEPPVSLRVTPRRRENGVGSPADADVSLGV